MVDLLELNTPELGVYEVTPTHPFFYSNEVVMSLSNADKKRREEAQKRVRETSREQFILEEMQRVGFWPADQDKPTLASHLIQEETRLLQELRELNKEDRYLGDPEKVLKRIKKERMAASRKRQKETKERREQLRIEKAKAWEEKKASEIIYLGDISPKGLAHTESDRQKLSTLRLPQLDDAADLAAAMNISVGELRFLAYHKEVSTTTHYQRYYIPKKSGGKRLISAPMPRLKNIQYWVLERILYVLPIHDAAHGFVPNRSILSNARPHLQADVVVNMDLKDFFPTITFNRVKGLFRSLGYSEQISILLASICTEPSVDRVEADGTIYYVENGPRRLPQGAPSSPMLTNLICQKMDRRMAGAAQKLGFKYTRYADDMTFSGSTESYQNVGRLLGLTKHIIQEEGFDLHPDKLHVMHKNRRQEVTGIVVNKKLNVNRRNVRKFKALIFQIEKDGIEGKHWGQGANLLDSILGFAQFYASVNPEKGKPLLRRTKAIVQQYRPKKKKASQKGTEKKPWWKFW